MASVDLMLPSILDQPIYGIPQAEKEASLGRALWDLTAHHRQSCAPYDRLCDRLGVESSGPMHDVPWLPVRLFKEHDLRSISEADVFRVLTSSGTTGLSVSRIFLDTDAASLHSSLLARTLGQVLGPKRLPMLIIDSAAVTKGRSFSARGAGVLGMMNFGRRHAFALDGDQHFDGAAVDRFLAEHGSQPFLIFGFTFMVWEYLRQASEHHDVDLSNGLLIHSGGWKKMEEQAVDATVFREELGRRFGLRTMHNFYGMVEQIGTVYVESPAGDGSLCCPSFADVIIRDPVTFEPVPHGTFGLIQTLSLSPRSYPGHSLLTEDLGCIVGENDGPWLGKRFVVRGRLPRAEARGCSDTFAGRA